MDEKNKKEKVSSLQAIIYTGPSKSKQAVLLLKALMPESKQSRQPEKVAAQTGKQGLL